jgi:hypothetical protein
VIRTSPSVGKDTDAVESFGILPAAGPRWSIAAPADAVSAPYFARTPVTVGETDLTNLIVTLEQAVTLSGVVSPDVPPVTFRGGVLPGRRLFLEPADPNSGLVSRNSGELDSSGAFVIDEVAPGSYFLRTTVETAIRSIRVGGRELIDEPIDVAGNVAGLTISRTEGASIHGDVRAGDSRASVRTTVIYFPSDRQLWSQVWSKSPRFGSVYVNTDGTYDTYRFLPGGEYYVVALPHDVTFDEWRDAAFLDAATRVATTVRVDWAQRVQQHLQVQEVRLR